MFKKIISKLLKTGFILTMIGMVAYTAIIIFEPSRFGVETTSHPKATLDTAREEPLDVKDAEPISILLAGLDSGAMMYEDAEVSRTDALIVATLNPETKQTTLTSIPRDTWVPIDQYQTFDKINHAYVYGGIQQTHSVLEKYLGIPIDYYITVDMKAFIEGINAMGGLEITPNQTFSLNGSSFEKDNRRVYDGTEVINYIRMRKEDPNGDNGRQARQRQVINEMMDQYIAIDTVTKIPEIYDLYKDHVESNVTITDGLQLLKQYQPALDNIRSISFEQHQDINRHGIYYLYINDKHRNTVHKALANNLEIEHNFNPIVYPLEQAPAQPYFETTDTNGDGVITHHDAPVPSGVYTQETLEQALRPYPELGY